MGRPGREHNWGGGEMVIANLIIIMLFIFLGTVFISGRGAFLIAGFNTLPQEEQDKYDTVALCKFMGK